jgi:hypothetical protein
MFGRRRRATVGRYVDPPLAPLAPIERVVEEGALIYVSSARMTVKNQIIVAAIGKQEDYAPDALRDALRRELERLADDNDETAVRLEATPAVAIENENDLDDDVVRQKREDQRRRPRVLRLTADHLRALALSEAEVDSLVEQARADAVDEMFRAINTRLAHGGVEADASYASEREQRLRDFVAFDLLGEEPAAPPEPPAAPTARRKRDRR